MDRATSLYAIGIGSNRPSKVGRPAAIVAAAIARLEADYGLFDASPIVLNPAAGGAGRDFANAVAVIESDVDPVTMLGSLKRLERDFGRRGGRRWGPRTLDLDILAWSGGRVNKLGLIVPHPRLNTRPFAIGLLAAIVPEWPLEGSRTAQQIYKSSRRRPII